MTGRSGEGASDSRLDGCSYTLDTMMKLGEKRVRDILVVLQPCTAVYCMSAE